MSRSRQTRRPKTYAAAGVSLKAADAMTALIGPLVRKTYGPRVFTEHGGFSGAFRLDYDERLFARNYKEPVLMACTDGVGSKLLVAIELGRYDTVGIDLVAMNVNDLLTSGAEPLFFLDYIALSRLKPQRTAEIISGIVNGCEQSGCALLGGETAEMPDLYRAGHFDLAGFSVGVVERRKIIDGSMVKPGDVIIGLASDGLHSNGYALARKLLMGSGKRSLEKVNRTLGEPLGDALIRPTKIYVRAVQRVLSRYKRRVVTAMAHITGGGLEGNLVRVLPHDCDAVIRQGSWEIPRIFALIQNQGVAEDEMYRVFNMGIGYVMVVRPAVVKTVVTVLEKEGIAATVIGTIKSGKGRVQWR
jgi:phosphoribosylformylglycinamidine cyclo-ligase